MAKKINLFIIWCCLFIIFFSINNLAAQDTIQLAKLIEEGITQEKHGQYEKAISKYKEALNLVNSDDQFKNPHQFRAHYYLGYGYLYDNELERAIMHLNRAVFYAKASQLYEQAVQITNEMGTIYLRLYRSDPFNRTLLDSSAYYYSSAIKTVEQNLSEGHLKHGECLYYLGTIAFFKSKFSHAKVFFLKAFKVFKKNKAQNTVPFSKLTNFLGSTYDNLINYDSSYYYYSVSLATKKKIYPPNHSELGLGYLNIALSSSFNLKYDESIRYLKSAMSIFEKNSFSHDPFRVYYMAGQIAMDAEAVYLAEGYYLKAMQLPQKDESLVPSLYVKLFETYIKKDNNQKGALYMEKACEAFSNSSLFGPTHWKTQRICKTYDTFKTLNPEVILDKMIQLKSSDMNLIIQSLVEDLPYLGHILSASPDSIYESRYTKLQHKAFELVEIGESKIIAGEYKEGLAVLQKAYPYIIPGFTDSLNTFNDPPVSEIDLFKVLRLSIISLKGYAHYQIWNSVNGKSPLYEEYLMNLLAQGDSLVKIYRYQNYEIENSKYVNTAINQLYVLQANYYIKLNEQTNDPNYLALAIQSLEKKKASNLIDQLNKKQLNSFLPIPSAITQKETELKNTLDDLERQILSAISDSDAINLGGYDKKPEISKLKDDFIAQLAAYDLFQNKIQKNYPQYATVKYGFDIVNPIEIQANLDDQTALISFYWINQSLLSSFITSDDIELAEVRFPTKLKDALPSILNCLLDKDCDLELFIENSQLLFQKLIPDLPNHIKRLLISPDGYLIDLPFEMLIAPDHNPAVKALDQIPYLGKSYAISYTLSPSLLFGPLSNTKRSIYTNDLLYYNTINEQEPAFLSTLAENTKLKIKFQSDSVASKKNFINENLSNYRMVHLEAHADIASNVSLINIFFGKEELYYKELFQLNLKTDLLIFDGCETGVGKYVEGEGPSGLISGALFAGANNIIYSKVWVDDSSQIYFKHFYTYLLLNNQNESPSYANAMLFTRQQLMKDKNTAHPSFWAKYYLEGE